MRLFKALLMLIITVVMANAQYQEYSKQSGIGLPFFKLQIHQHFLSDLKKTSVLVMTEFLNDDLTFLKGDKSGFKAELELVIAVYDQDDNILISRTVNRKTAVEKYEDTNSRTASFYHKEDIELESGKYKLFIKAMDIHSDKSAQRKVEIVVEDFAKKDLSIGAISFLKEATFDSLSRLVDFQPSFGNNFDIRSGSFYVYFDLYTANIENEVNLAFKIYNESKKPDVDSSYVFRPDKNINSVIIRLDREDLLHNKYTLELNAEEGKNKTKKTQVFSFFWSDIPTTNEDISTALYQMAYILSSDSLNKYTDAELSEQQAFFIRFWKDHDPDPQTEKNELKNEYFNRVNHANQQFKSMGENGWKSDRGRILIKFGYPDDIERHPFEIDRKPFEIWRYYTLRRVFYFIDITGFGDYRLHPDFLEEEYK